MISFTRLIPHLTRRQCIQISVSTRQMSMVSKVARIRPENSLYDREKHKVVYNFPSVVYYASFIRLKYSIPFISVGACLVHYLLYKDLSVLPGAGVLVLIHLGLIHLLSKFLVNTVGKIYVNKNGDVEEVIISVVDKSGRKRDYKHSPNALYILDPYTKVQGMLNIFSLMAKDSESIYKLYFSWGKIVDNEAAKTVIGEDNLNKIQMLREKKKKKK